nr:unnamed protein product [uncultured bacterium]
MPKFMNLPFILASGSTVTGVNPADWASIIEGVTGQFSVANIVAVIASVVAAGIGFVFLWWGVRIAFRSIMGAVKNGSLSINARRGRRR